MSLKLNTASGGSITLQEADTASNLTLTVPAVSGTMATVDGSGNASVTGNLSFNSGYGSSAVAYGCRAWVNFDGTGTVAIRASGNVSSITDRGTGLYTINFTNAMPDANYTVASCGTSSANYRTAIDDISQAPQTTGVRIITQTGNGTDNDTPYGLFSIFR